VGVLWATLVDALVNVIDASAGWIANGSADRTHGRLGPRAGDKHQRRYHNQQRHAAAAAPRARKEPGYTWPPLLPWIMVGEPSTEHRTTHMQPGKALSQPILDGQKMAGN
jgi:hypothetical protein